MTTTPDDMGRSPEAGQSTEKDRAKAVRKLADALRDLKGDSVAAFVFATLESYERYLEKKEKGPRSRWVVTAVWLCPSKVTYLVEADSPEEAERLCREGEGEYQSSSPYDDESDEWQWLRALSIEPA
jgi:hypothetical protein